MSNKSTFLLDDDTKRQLRELAEREYRSQTNIIKFLIHSYYTICECYYCDERVNCDKFQRLRDKLDNKKMVRQ